MLKDTPPAEIVDAVRRVARGLPVLSPAVTRRLIARVAGPGHDRRTRARERLAQLNEREREVAVAVGQGRSNAEIGAVLYLSVPTVKTHEGRSGAAGGGLAPGAAPGVAELHPGPGAQDGPLVEA